MMIMMMRMESHLFISPFAHRKHKNEMYVYDT
jgi:hypothetical protein